MAVEQTVWIARHANRVDFVDPEWMNRADRPEDPPLSPDGWLQAGQLADRLSREGIGRIVTSPFLRTVQTAHVVAKRLALPMAIEPGLCEWLNPDWFSHPPRLLSVDDLEDRIGGIDRSYVPQVTPRYPEPSGLTTLARAGETSRKLVDRYAEDLLLIGHGVTVAGAMVGLAPEADRMMYDLCALVQVVREDGVWRVELNGDTSHLSPREDEVRYH